MLARERYEAYALLLIAHAAALLVVGVGLAIPFGLTGAVDRDPRLGARRAPPTRPGCSWTRPPATRLPTAAARWRRAVRFGLQSWGANLLQQLNYRFDVVILGGVREPLADVGVYSVALTLTGIAWVLPQALQTVLFPRAAEPRRVGAHRRAQRATSPTSAREGDPPRRAPDAADRARRWSPCSWSAFRSSTARSSTRRSPLGFILLPGRAPARRRARSSPPWSRDAATRATRSTSARSRCR